MDLWIHGSAAGAAAGAAASAAVCILSCIYILNGEPKAEPFQNKAVLQISENLFIFVWSRRMKCWGLFEMYFAKV